MKTIHLRHGDILYTITVAAHKIDTAEGTLTEKPDITHLDLLKTAALLYSSGDHRSPPVAAITGRRSDVQSKPQHSHTEP
jgi:hypothetical protein